MSDTLVESRNDSAQFAEKTAQVKQLLAELAALAPGAAREQISSLKDSASWLYQQGARRAKDAGSKVVTTVKQRPAETVLAGVVLGLLAWWMIVERRKPADADNE